MARDLPIWELHDDFAAAAQARRRLIVRAPTGSGKSTQIPQMIVDDSLAAGQTVVLQPRRLAARLLAARVARERGGVPGAEVGYQVRFESRCGPSTRLRYVTEGVLLRQMLDDPALGGVGAIVFDEFHERHLYGDVTLGHALEIQETLRPDLLLAVMSATLDTEKIEAFFGGPAVLRSEGRTYPVDIRYRSSDPRRRPEPPVWEQAADAFEEIAAACDGHVLVFMPGAWEIHRTIEELRARPAARGWALMPLHGELPAEQQDDAVAPAAGRKVIVATNIAETSITIDGVRAVIDSGLARIPKYDPARGINTLLIERISRASADQRAGRAGRTGPGLCVRLWSEADHRTRPAEEAPEVWRLDLAEVALLLKAAGHRDLAAFRWLDPPGLARIERAERLLRDLGATDAAGAITPMGRRMLAFPVHPRHARMLIEAGARGAVPAAAAIAALVQGRDIFLSRVDRDVEGRRAELLGDASGSDFFPRLRALAWAERHRWNPAAGSRYGIRMSAARDIAALRDRFLAIARAQGLAVDSPAPDDEAIRRCVLAGFADHVAARLDMGTLRCRLVHRRRGELVRSSAVRDAPLIAAAEVRETEGRDIEVLLSLATAIRPEWLREMFPDAVREEIDTEWDAASRRVVAWRRLKYHDVTLDENPAEPDPARASEILADEAMSGGLHLDTLNEEVEQWMRRAELVARLLPEAGVRAPTDGDLRAAVAAACHGAVSARELQRRPVLPALRMRWSPAEQRAIEDHAPQKVTLANGRSARVVYEAQGDPWIAVRIQHLYGVTALPSVLGGRAPLVVRILAPNQRPVQVTRDLAGFWANEYPRVRSELARRYPKHEWR